VSIDLTQPQPYYPRVIYLGRKGSSVENVVEFSEHAVRCRATRFRRSNTFSQSRLFALGESALRECAQTVRHVEEGVLLENLAKFWEELMVMSSMYEAREQRREKYLQLAEGAEDYAKRADDTMRKPNLSLDLQLHGEIMQIL
jgi:hypothetical protein